MFDRLRRRLRETLVAPSRRLLGAGLVGLVLFGPGLCDWARMSLMQRRLDRRLAALSAERERLTHEQERLTSDPGYVEGLIRSTFKVAQPGEYVIQLEPSSPQSTRRVANQ